MPVMTNKSRDNARRTLSGDLRNRLILMVSAIFTVIIVLNYGFASHRSSVWQDEKAAEYLVYLRDNLSVPLWNMDRDWIKSICGSFANNDMIGFLRVTGPDGEVLFQTGTLPAPDLAQGKTELHAKGYHIGTVELSLSGQVHARQNNNVLMINLVIMVLVILGIAVSTRLILSNILERPLSLLLGKIDDISDGEYAETAETFGHVEMKTILEKFNHMAGRVQKRELSLKQANRRLESEIAVRKAAEKAHQASEERYRQLVEDLTVGLFRSSPEINGPFLMVNPALVAMLGYETRESLLEKSVSSIYKSPGMRARFLDILFEQGEITGYEHEFVKRDGTVLVGLTTCHVCRDADGNPLYIDGIIEDITHRKQMEKQIKQAQKMEALGTLAGGIAHDFNNILSSIFGFAEVTKIRYKAGKDIDDSLDEILSAGIRARGLIKQILAFSRQSEAKRMAVTISPIVKETSKFLRASLPAMIEIRYDIRDADAVILGDPTQIHQVLMNLCTNSAQAMADGGCLDISLDRIDTGETGEFQGLAAGNYVRLRVRDTGYGIEAAHLERIFEPFFTTKQRGQGTGMGLAMVHGIISEMGGDVRVESTPGQGSLFTVLIPTYTGDPESLPLDHGPAAAGRGRILFVDDEAGFRESGTEILGANGYEVIPAEGGDEALAFFQKRPHDIDLVVTDMVMPRMTGVELASRLREIRPGIRIILCTGFSVGITGRARADAGISDVVMKPLLARELISAVENTLNPALTPPQESPRNPPRDPLSEEETEPWPGS